MNDAGQLFSADYSSARQGFRKAARDAGAQQFAIELEAMSPSNEKLTIDIARIGPRDAPNVLLHFSGVHGVEGFLGSAIQRQLLRDLPTTEQTQSLVFVHAVNPFGMSWLRRVNENNVDLNRNFFLADEKYAGAPDGYVRLNPLLNPTGPPKACEPFALWAGWYIVRHGFQNLKQAVAGGQYEFPQGLFFGGKELEQGPAKLAEWLQDQLRDARIVTAVDVHSGLGKSGQDTLLVPETSDSDQFRHVSSVLGDRVQSLVKEGVAYEIRGGLLDGLASRLTNACWICIGQEFGTYPPLRILRALRDENRWHHYGEQGKIDHPAKLALLEMFCPADRTWRETVVGRGDELVRTLIQSPL